MIHPDLMTGIMAEVMELVVVVVVDEDEVEEEVEEGEMEVAEAAVDVEDVVEEAVVILVEVTTWDMEETSHKIL